MKRLMMFVGAILVACLGLFLFRKNFETAIAGNPDTIIVYNWGDYIDPGLLTQFEEETGYKVIYETFDSNEAMYTKIKQGGTNYDVAIPSEYAIHKMLKEDLLVPLDYSKEMMGIALQTQGYSLNEKDPEVVRQAGKFLKTLMPNAKAIIADEMKTYMAQEEASIGVSFSGEAAKMLERNEDLAYVLPEEGTNLWFDNIVIPKTAKNYDGAYRFISFLLRPDIAAKNAEYVGYSTPNKDALELLPEEVTSDETFYPTDEQMEHMEVYENLGSELLGLYNDLFLEAKIFRN